MNSERGMVVERRAVVRFGIRLMRLVSMALVSVPRYAWLRCWCFVAMWSGDRWVLAYGVSGSKL